MMKAPSYVSTSIFCHGGTRDAPEIHELDPCENGARAFSPSKTIEEQSWPLTAGVDLMRRLYLLHVYSQQGRHEESASRIDYGPHSDRAEDTGAREAWNIGSFGQADREHISVTHTSQLCSYPRRCDFWNLGLNIL